MEPRIVGIRRLHIFRIPRRDSLGSRNCIVAVDFSPYNSSQWEHGRDLVEGQRQMVSLLPNPQFVEVFHRQRPPLHGSGAIVGCDPSLSSDQVAARLAGSDLGMCRARSSHTKRAIFFLGSPAKHQALPERNRGAGRHTRRSGQRSRLRRSREATDQPARKPPSVIETESLAKRVLALSEIQPNKPLSDNRL